MMYKKIPMYPFVQPLYKFCTALTHLFGRCPCCTAAPYVLLLLLPSQSRSKARKATGFTLIQPGNNKRICSNCNCHQRIQYITLKKSKSRHNVHELSNNKNNFYSFFVRRGVAGSKQVVCGVIRVLGKQNWFHAFVADGRGIAADKRVAIVIHMIGETMTMRQSAYF